MTYIAKGTNTPVPTGPVRVAVVWGRTPGAPSVSASALLVTPAGTVRGGGDLVALANPRHMSGAVRHAGRAEGAGQFAEWLELDLHTVEPGVDRVLVAASCAGGVMGAVPGLHVQALAPDATPLAGYAVTDAGDETALLLGEFYRRAGGWRFRAVGQGYANGFAGLAGDFGLVRDGTPECLASGGPASASVAPVQVPPSPVAPEAAPPRPAGYTEQVSVPVDTRPGDAAGPVGAPYLGAEFPVFEERGNGDGMIDVPSYIPPGPLILELHHRGDGYINVQALADDDRESESIVTADMADFRCRTITRCRSDRPLRFDVTADNEWLLRVLPLSAARPLHERAEGFGHDVFLYTGTRGDLVLDHPGEARKDFYAVYTFQPGPTDDPNVRFLPKALHTNGFGNVSETVPLPDGPVFAEIESYGSWQVTARPTVVVTGAEAERSGVYQDRGDATVTVVNPAPGQPSVLEYTVAPTDDFTVMWLDEYDDPYPLLQDSDGTSGRTVLFPRGERETRIRLEGVEDWTLRLVPLDEVPELAGPVEGDGSAVFRYTGEPALLAARCLAEGLSGPRVRCVQPDGRSALVTVAHGQRPAVGPLWVSRAGHCLVTVSSAEGTPWRLEPLPADSAPAGGADLAGWGHAVVRHTGPGAELLVGHGHDDRTDTIEVWRLDERLRPVRRVADGPGLAPVPAGTLHIRTHGRWDLGAAE
ncbi:TerD family protein [Streptomyces uncialis]|uniref:TerD family protein n=1 Tax=Streptomyces uncialis TaxID=1048205 RepID=UPI0037FB43FD